MLIQEAISSNHFQILNISLKERLQFLHCNDRVCRRKTHFDGIEQGRKEEETNTSHPLEYNMMPQKQNRKVNFEYSWRTIVHVQKYMSLGNLKNM